MKVKALCIKPIHGVYIDEAEVLLVKSNEKIQVSFAKVQCVLCGALVVDLVMFRKVSQRH